MAKVSLRTATAAPTSLKIGDKTYRVSPLRDKDWGEFEGWMQDRQMDLAKRSLEGLTEADRRTLLTHAFDRASRLTIQSPEALAIMATIDGAAKLLWLATRRDAPELTEEAILTWMLDESNLDTAIDSIDRLNFRGGPRAKKTKRHRRK